jgi:hypothetical protein
MGDAILVALPVISLIAVAVGLIVRGSRQSKTQAKVAKAVWKVGMEPNGDATVVYLYKEVGGKEVKRDKFARVERAGDNYTDRLLAMQEAAELEVSILNSNTRR